MKAFLVLLIGLFALMLVGAEQVNYQSQSDSPVVYFDVGQPQTVPAQDLGLESLPLPPMLADNSTDIYSNPTVLQTQKTQAKASRIESTKASERRA